ncbi:rhodanese-like domain-containing protein [Streptomyces misionensis]|uniref:rhodanese-like domain-containing protein n=1 Tax=Streptomyces misionensis TaxID=67331 RepID=UPI0033A5AFDD
MFLFRSGEDRLPVDEARRRTSRADAPAVLLDVPEDAEWTAGHAPGAVHASLSLPTTGRAPASAASERSLMVICRSGNRSQWAAGTLAAGRLVVDEHGNHGSIA